MNEDGKKRSDEFIASDCLYKLNLFLHSPGNITELMAMNRRFATHTKINHLESNCLLMLGGDRHQEAHLFK